MAPRPHRYSDAAHGTERPLHTLEEGLLEEADKFDFDNEDMDEEEAEEADEDSA